MASPTHANPDNATYLDLSFNTLQLEDSNEFTLVGKLITTKSINYKAIVSILGAA